MRQLASYLLFSFLAMILSGCNADDGTTSGQTGGGTPGGLTPTIKLGLLRDYYHFDNSSSPAHQVFPVDSPDPVSVAFQYDDMTGYNTVEFRLVNAENSTLRFRLPDGSSETEFFADVVDMKRGDVGLVYLAQNQHPFRLNEEVVVNAVNVVSVRSDGSYEISGQREIGRLIFDFYAVKSIDIEIVNATTYGPSGKTNDVPKKYSGSALRELMDYFITTAGIDMTNVYTSERNVVFDDNGDGALNIEPILRYTSPEFSALLQNEVPGQITVLNIKDIHTYFSLAANVALDDKEFTITSIGGLKLPSGGRVFIDDPENFKDEYVIATLKSGSAQTYTVVGGGPAGGFKYSHASVTTKANSQYLVQGVASPSAHVAVIQEGDFNYENEEARDQYFGLTAAHEIFHSQDFQLDHVSAADNVMFPDYPPGVNLNKSQWDKIHGF